MIGEAGSFPRMTLNFLPTQRPCDAPRDFTTLHLALTQYSSFFPASQCMSRQARFCTLHKDSIHVHVLSLSLIHSPSRKPIQVSLLSTILTHSHSTTQSCTIPFHPKLVLSTNDSDLLYYMNCDAHFVVSQQLTQILAHINKNVIT
jgi:hypothetical protein